MGGAIRIKRAEYFLSHFIRMHGNDVILFGDGNNLIVHLQIPYILSPFLLKSIRIGEDNLWERVKEVKEKVLNWLKEESLSPEEVSDPNAYFNFSIKVAGQPFHIVQNVRSLDSVFVGANLVLTPAQLSLLKNNMNKNKRQEYFWDLRLALLSNLELGDFQIKPNPPDDVREIFISSKTLVRSIYSIYKAAMMIIWMLERYAGASMPEERET